MPWREPRRIGGYGLCFSPDGCLLVVRDASKILLVETETGRTLVRLESPDLCAVQCATFSPDGSRLVITTNDGPAVHLWDLRVIRRRLAEMGLDWDARPLPAPKTSPVGAEDRSPLKVDVDFGPLKRYSEQYQSHLEQYTLPTEELVARYTERLRAHPGDPDSLHQRGHALLRLKSFEEALADFSTASSIRPLDAHLRAYHGVCLFALNRYTQALDQRSPGRFLYRVVHPPARRPPAGLPRCLPLRSESVHTGLGSTRKGIPDRSGIGARDRQSRQDGKRPGLGAGHRRRAQRDPVLAARLATLSVALSPGEQTSLDTLGVALYRAGRFAEAIETLGKSLKAGKGQFDGFDLFFLAMAHHRLVLLR